MHGLARADVFDHGAPKPYLDNGMPQGTTMPYDKMMKEWQSGNSQ